MKEFFIKVAIIIATLLVMSIIPALLVQSGEGVLIDIKTILWDVIIIEMARTIAICLLFSSFVWLVGVGFSLLEKLGIRYR
jgi:hypothetical protein